MFSGIFRSRQAALGETYPESRSEVGTGVLLLPGDEFLAVDLGEGAVRSLLGNVGGKLNIGIVKSADGSPGHHNDL